MSEQEKRYGMLIDLALCVGCNACSVACKQENGVPLGAFNTWVESWDVEKDGQVSRANLPKQCNHCVDAPCVKVCPAEATYRTEDGVVLVDEEKCIGCGACVNACPFEARWLDAGKAGKCTFCYHRTSHGLLPACVGTCITRARYFGDMNDPESDISKKIAELGAESMGDAYGIDLSVRYVGLSEVQALPVASAVHRGGNVIKRYEA